MTKNWLRKKSSSLKKNVNFYFSDLSQNDLERIEDDSFLPLIKLKNLNLASNKIRTLEENAFKGLQSVTQL